jgi:hypothetical protein
MSAAVWVMVAIALWHFTVLVPDRFYGGIVGAFLASLGGALALGFAASGFGIPTANPPGIEHVLLAVPGASIGLAVSYIAGVRTERTSS